MKRILILLLMLCAWSQVNATTVAIVVKDNTSGSTIKADTLLGNACRDILGWTVHYRDLDSVFTPATWTGFGYSLVILAGTEVASAGAAFNNATVAADSIAKTSIPMMAIGNQFWNEINLGTGVLDNQPSDPWYVVNIGQNHWITKVVHDSIVIWTRQGGATTTYAIAFPDSINNRGITPLVISRTYMADTSRYLLGVCETGASIVNTGDNRGTSNQRRSFFGLFQNQAKAMDSCQFYTLFLRTAAWTAGDTLNAGVMNGICFSGTFELHDAWSGGSEPEGAYAVYSSGGIRMGHDYDDKITFLQVDSLALKRKVRDVYRSLTCSSVLLRTKVSSATVQYSSVGGDSNWVQYWTFVPSRKRLHVTNFPYGTAPVASNTYPATCYYWARIDTVGGIGTGDTILWASAAARSTTEDVTLEYSDSALFSRATFAADTYYNYTLNAARWTSGLMSYAGSCIDYVARNLSDNQSGSQPPGVEVGIYSGNSYASVTGLPSISITLSASSTTDPVPTIAFEFDSLTMASTVGTNPDGNVYNHNNVVSNGSGGALSCVSVTDDATWLSTTITGTDQTPFGVTAVIDVTGLSAGYHSALVTVQCDDADNSPATFKVALTLTAAAPAPSVEPRSGYRRNN